MDSQVFVHGDIPELFQPGISTGVLLDLWSVKISELPTRVGMAVGDSGEGIVPG